MPNAALRDPIQEASLDRPIAADRSGTRIAARRRVRLGGGAVERGVYEPRAAAPDASAARRAALEKAGP